MYIEEGQALDKLVEAHGPGSVTRRDPDDQGPLIFHAGDGNVYEIDGHEVRWLEELSGGER